VQWSDLESVSTGPSKAGDVICLVLAPHGESRRPKTLLIPTLTARSEALVVLAQQIETHVPADRITAKFASWARMTNQRQSAMSTTQTQ